MAAAPSLPAQAATNRSVRSEPTLEDIRCRAYEVYCDRNGGPGDALSDWLAAEVELRGAPQAAADDLEKRRALALLQPTDGDPMC